MHNKWPFPCYVANEMDVAAPNALISKGVRSLVGGTLLHLTHKISIIDCTECSCFCGKKDAQNIMEHYQNIVDE